MRLKKVLAVLGIAILGGFTAFGISWFFSGSENLNTENVQPYMPTYNLTNNQGSVGSTDFTFAAEQTVNAVVHVKTTLGSQNRQPSIYDFFFGSPQGGNMMPSIASGSGVILTNDGYIVTNNHVVQNSKSVEVVLNDKRSFEAELIGRDPSTDIALLKIKAKDLPTIPFGNSDNLKIGEWVLAVGNPFNLTSTVTAGIVSAKGRNLNLLQQSAAIESFIQTDAAVNPGNSGGALVNVKGELVGINTAIASQTGSYSGYSFAVPVSIVKKVVSDLTEYGTVQRALLGINIQDINAEKADELGLDKPEGVFIAGVNSESAADDAGIKAEDVIVKIDNVKIGNIAQLQEQISRHSPGDKIIVSVKRNKKIKQFEVTLKNSMGTTQYVNKESMEVLGASFIEISDREKADLGLNNGVKITDIGAGKLLKVGVREGFIITHINRQSVRTVDDIQNGINQVEGGIFIKGVYPNGKTAYYAFSMDKDD